MEKAKRYRLPTWLDDLLPEEKQPVVIDMKADGMLWATMPDGTRRELSMDIEEAYDAIRGDEGEGVCFTAAVQEKFRDEEYPGLFSPSIGIPSSNGNTRLLMSYTDADRRDCLEVGWESFLETDKEWRDDPSFCNSFHWIDRHPAFWTRACRRRPDDDAWHNSNLWQWNTEGYMQHVWVCPGNWDTDGILIALEAGAHVPNEEKWGDDPQDPSR
ncbi:MAG: hypothetical protein LBK67_05680, partial [Coriobacteriales bacterium]|nr:hypothetical protein [Coriobacteriales bacterium]